MHILKAAWQHRTVNYTSASKWQHNKASRHDQLLLNILASFQGAMAAKMAAKIPGQ